MILAGAHQEFRLSPLDIFQMKTEHFGSAPEARHNSSMMARLRRLLAVHSQGTASTLPSSSGESAAGKPACFHCRTGGIANSRCAESNPSPVM